MSQRVESNRIGRVRTFQHWSKTSATTEPVHALVTGASGFIGMHLAERLLAEGKRVRLFVRRPEAVRELTDQGAEVVTGAIDDVETVTRAVEGVEQVFHLAAMTSALNVDDMLRANGEGSRNVARACAAQQNPPVLVQVSSIAAAGPTERGRVRVETDVPAPVSNYGRSKLAGEQAVAEFAGDVPTTIVRPGIVFGPRNREMLPMFKSVRYLNAHFMVGLRTPPVSILHVEDTVEVILRAAQKGSRLPEPRGDAIEQLTSGTGVYFAVAPEIPEYAELGRFIRKSLHRPFVTNIPLLGPAPWLAARLSERIAKLRGKPDSFNLDKIREAVVPSWACSNQRAERELGLKPQQSLQERFDATVAWYLEHRWI